MEDEVKDSVFNAGNNMSVTLTSTEAALCFYFTKPRRN